MHQASPTAGVENSAGGAQGYFFVSFGPGLAPTGRQFWWPPGATSQQPPLKNGQNRSGHMGRFEGLAQNSFTLGYEPPVPVPALVNGDMRLFFEMSGFGKVPVRLGAEHFVDSGEVRLFADFSYMVDQ